MIESKTCPHDSSVMSSRARIDRIFVFILIIELN
jgi:hypothetical protein